MNYKNLWNKFRNTYGKNFVIAVIPYDLKSMDKVFYKHKILWDLMNEMKKCEENKSHKIS